MEEIEGSLLAVSWRSIHETDDVHADQLRVSCGQRAEGIKLWEPWNLVHLFLD